MTPDEAFLADICSAPDDDAPRLIYADWLEECGDGDRAEFIRVQCELVRLEHPSPPGVTEDTPFPGPRLEVLRRRERELLHLLRPQLRDELPPAKPYCHAWRLYLLRHDDSLDDDFTVAYDRGFPAKVTLTCAAFAGGPCPLEFCEGGYWRHSGDPNTYRTKCHVCHGTGHTEGVAAALFRAAPVREVVLGDRVPCRTFGGHYGWGVDGDEGNPENSLPERLWDLMEPKGGRRDYYTEQAARGALSAAACLLGRRRASSSDVTSCGV